MRSVHQFKLVTFFSALSSFAHAAIYNDPSDVVSKQYDYIIVGAGTAGGVVASRLSEDSSISVLVIEAGLSDNGTDSASLHCPLLAGSAAGTEYDWQYVTTSQSGLNGRALPYARGLVMGGSSALNAMVYSRGPSEDFDRIASVSGDQGWSWNSLQPFIQKNERHVPDWSNRDDTGEYNPAVHGTGPLMTSLTANVTHFDNLIFQAVDEIGGQFKFNVDLNSGDGLGFGWMQSTVGEGSRSDSSTAFLTPALNSRSNIDLLLQTQVIKLTSSSDDQTDIRTVQFAQSSSAPVFNLTATKEVILSAGSIGTPQLLLLSGIGPADELSSLGIDSIVDLPDVGKNLQDQGMTVIQYQVNAATFSPFFDDTTALEAAVTQWATSATGFAASGVLINTIGYLRLDSSVPPLSTNPDPSAGPNSPHYTFAFEDTFVANPNQDSPTTGNWISASVVVQSPTSRGSLNLSSTSAFDHPLIDPGFLTTTFDQQALVQAVRSVQNFLNASAFDGFIGSPYSDAANLSTDDEILEYARTWMDTLHHPVATAKISKTTDSDGVVGPDLKVKGVSGLRVVDASILPYATGGFPQAQVYIIAERGASLIAEAA